MDNKDDPPLTIAIVGPCSSGKSSLAPTLLGVGFKVRQPTQEHAYVLDKWRRTSVPDILIYLDITYAEARCRRPHIDGGPQRLAEQHRRLSHARQHADFYLDTSDLTPEVVQVIVLDFLREFTGKALGLVGFVP